MVKIFNNGSENIELYLKSNSERFKLLYVDSFITYDFESWKLDKYPFDQRGEDSQVLSLGQAYITLFCSSISEYMEIYSYLLSRGWKNRIRWSKEFKERYGLSYWDKYSRLEPVWYNSQSFQKALNERGSLTGIVFEMDPAAEIRIKVDYNKLNDFRDLIKSFRSLGYKSTWYKRAKSGKIIDEIR